MADKLVVKYLNDMLDSIKQIESYFDTLPRRFDIYCKTPMMQRAIQMNISIIGEATAHGNKPVFKHRDCKGER